MAGVVSHARSAFAVAFIAAQVGLVATAGRRPDGAFGFRMFNESSTVQVSLSREVVSLEAPDAALSRVPVSGGEWHAHDARGVAHTISWRDRVRRPELSVFDVEMSAAYGANAQLARWTAALDDVASHLDHDAETRRLVLDVTVRRNGGEPETVTVVRDVRGPGLRAGGR
jgi:hypothetical protein